MFQCYSCFRGCNNKRDQKETVYANLKTLNAKDFWANIKALVQVQGQIKVTGKCTRSMLKTRKHSRMLRVERIRKTTNQHCHKSISTILIPCFRRAQVLNHLNVKHQHNLSLIIGVTRTIRLNATQCWIFKSSNIVQSDQIYLAFASTMSRECFNIVHKQATNDPQGLSVHWCGSKRTVDAVP